jgi:hypothetical protein
MGSHAYISARVNAKSMMWTEKIYSLFPLITFSTAHTASIMEIANFVLVPPITRSIKKMAENEYVLLR